MRVKFYSYTSGTHTVVGSTNTTPGYIYHWMLKLDEKKLPSMNIGIIEAGKCDDYQGVDHWIYPYTYSIYPNGQVWDNDACEKCANGLKAGDMIDIWLDLRNNYNLSFGQNGQKYGNSIDVAKGKQYKLAIGSRGGILTLLSFQISC